MEHGLSGYRGTDVKEHLFKESPGSQKPQKIMLVEKVFSFAKIGFFGRFFLGGHCGFQHVFFITRLTVVVFPDSPGTPNN